MMKFKLINNEVTDEREKALGNKVLCRMLLHNDCRDTGVPSL